MKKKPFVRYTKASAPIGIRLTDPDKIQLKYLDRRRHGKTKRDQAGGARQRAFERKQFPIRRTSSGGLPADGGSIKLMGG